MKRSIVLVLICIFTLSIISATSLFYNHYALGQLSPVANDDVYPTHQGEIYAESAPGVLVNDEGLEIFVKTHTQPLHGLVEVYDDGGIIYGAKKKNNGQRDNLFHIHLLFMDIHQFFVPLVIPAPACAGTGSGGCVVIGDIGTFQFLSFRTPIRNPCVFSELHYWMPDQVRNDGQKLDNYQNCDTTPQGRGNILTF